MVLAGRCLLPCMTGVVQLRDECSLLPMAMFLCYARPESGVLRGQIRPFVEHFQPHQQFCQLSELTQQCPRSSQYVWAKQKLFLFYIFWNRFCLFVSLGCGLKSTPYLIPPGVLIHIQKDLAKEHWSIVQYKCQLHLSLFLICKLAGQQISCHINI